MILPMIYNRTSSDTRITAADMVRICTNINEITGGSLRTNWTSNDIVDVTTWQAICDRAASLGRYPVTYATDYVNVNYIERSLFEHYDATHHITADPKLTALAVSGGSLSPVFNPVTYAYTVTVSSLTSQITAATDYSAISYVVNGVTVSPSEVTWQPGTNTLQVTATLNGQSQTYTVTVVCTYQEAELLTLTIGGESVSVSSYMTLTTENGSDEVEYTATGEVTLQLNGEEVTGLELSWLEGTNTLQITVTADDTRVYTVVIDSLYEAPLPAGVAGISISDATMSPAFSSEVLEYVVYPGDDTATIDIIPEEGVKVVILFNGTEIENGGEIEWSEDGRDVITVTASGEGMTDVVYTIKVKAEITTTMLPPMRAGETIAGDPLVGGAFS